MKEIKLPPYIVSFAKRKKFSRKIRDTQKEIEKLKSQGDWKQAATLEYKLRNSWWGYKRYK